jgi:hypothetical protein
MVQQISTNTFGCAKWIVSSDATQGTHTTIASALNSASSGDTIFIRPGTYTENLTLKSGVNITAFSDGYTPNVTIVGNCTATFAGTCTISGVRLQTNGAAFLTVSGINATIVNLVNCYLNCTDATGISFTSSSSSAVINCRRCDGDITTIGIALFSASSAGTLNFFYCKFENSGGSTTASTTSATLVQGDATQFTNPVNTSSTGALSFVFSSFFTQNLNATAITTAGTGTSNLTYCRIFAGSASAISVGAGTTVNARNCYIGSSNTNTITGAGTVVYSNLGFFPSTSTGTINTTTQTAFPSRYGIQSSSKQPAFQAIAAAQSNVTGDGTAYTVTFTATEVLDQNGDFDGTSTFTANVAGGYIFTVTLSINGITGSHTTGVCNLVTTARSYSIFSGSLASVQTGGNAFRISGSVFCTMAAGDTATVLLQVSGGTKVISVTAAASGVCSFGGVKII